jgi:hypothetical protein
MTATTLVIAHTGHVLIDGPLFLGPPVVMAIALWVSARRNKRAGDGGPGRA